MSDSVKKSVVDKSADIADEAEIIAPEPDGFITLTEGYKVVVNRLRLREFLALMKVVTRGASPIMASVSLEATADPAEFAKNFLGLLLFAIPEAEDEIIAFIRLIVTPQVETPESLLAVDIALDNPEIEDIIIILEQLVSQEATSVQSLGKRLGNLFNLAKRLGQV